MKAKHRGMLGRGGQVAAAMGMKSVAPPVALKKKAAKKKPAATRDMGALRAFGGY